MGRGFRGGAGMKRGRGRGNGRGCGTGRGKRTVMGAESSDGYLTGHDQNPPEIQQSMGALLSPAKELVGLKEQAKAIESQLSELHTKKTLLEGEAEVPSLLAEVIQDKCTGCSVCLNVCPAGAISMVNEVAIIKQSQCKGCGQCSTVCPEDAIVIKAILQSTTWASQPGHKEIK